MRYIAFFFAVIFLLFNLTINSFMVQGEDNPYELKNYQSLNIDDARKCSFSYDGKIIVFKSIAEKPDMSSIWIANSDGTNRTQVYRNFSIDDTFTGAKFSPDGEKIIFTKKQFVSNQIKMTIELLRKNGTHWNYTNPEEVYTVYSDSLRYPSFSPDGKKIIYFTYEGGGKGDVWVMNSNGTNNTQLTFDKDGGDNPSYSPDGTKILYERWSDNGESEIWIMNANGKDKKMVLDDSWYPYNPSFMPDGKILFESARVSPHSKKIGVPSIWMMEQDGSNKTLLVPYLVTSSGSSRPAVSPDGTKIIFENGVGDSFHLYYVEDPDGDGIWEDSDGDHVADICDGYPDDPDRGYIKDDDENDSSSFGLRIVLVSIFIAVPVVWWLKPKK